MLLRFALICLCLFVVNAFAGEVRTYRFSQPVSVAGMEEPLEASVAVDIWWEKGEQALIGAEFAIERVIKSGDGEQRWSRRRLVMSDVTAFRRYEENIFMVEMNDTGQDADGLLIIGDEKSDQLEIYFGEKGLYLDHGLKSAQRIVSEADYEPPRLLNLKIVFEPGNRSVSAHSFFANRKVHIRHLSGATINARPPNPRVPAIVPVAQDNQRSDPPRGDSIWNKISSPSSSWSSNPISRSSLSWTTSVIKNEVNQLLELEDRPRLIDIIRLMRTARERLGEKFDIRANPFFSNYEYRAQRIEQGMSRMGEFRRRLDMLFPDAQWYLLGRDVYLLADALEAEYLAQGKTGRVRRLPASAPSFASGDLDLTYDFLRSHGIDLGSVNADSPAQIVLDISSYSGGTYRLSQSRQLMRAGYRHWIEELGQAPELLVRKFNFLNTMDSHNHAVANSPEERDLFFSKLTFGPEPNAVMSVHAPNQFQYTQGWHGMYQSFRRENGRVVAPRGEASSSSTRVDILGEMWGVIAFYGPEFLDRASGLCDLYLD